MHLISFVGKILTDKHCTHTEAAEPGGGGALGASAPPLFVPGEKVPFFGNESALFSQNRSAVLAKRKCPFWSVPPHFRGASAASQHKHEGSEVLFRNGCPHCLMLLPVTLIPV